MLRHTNLQTVQIFSYHIKYNFYTAKIAFFKQNLMNKLKNNVLFLKKKITKSILPLFFCIFAK